MENSNDINSPKSSKKQKELTEMKLCVNKHCIPSKPSKPSKRLPIVICCDNRIKDFEREELIDLLIDNIFNDINTDAKLRDCVDVAFVRAVSDINRYTSSDFSSSFNLVSSTRKYKSVCFSSLSEAITYSYDIIVKRTNEYECHEFTYYPPMIVIIGTCDIPGDDTLQSDVVKRIGDYCNPQNNNLSLSNIIIPVVFAIGKGSFESLQKCASNYLNAGFHIDKSNINRMQFKYLVSPCFNVRDYKHITKEIILKEYKESFDRLRELLINEVYLPSTISTIAGEDIEELLKDLSNE